MDKLTEFVKAEIKRQFKSINHFAEVSGIPYSTLANALNKGIGNTSYGTVIKIYNLLGLDQNVGNNLEVSSKQLNEMTNMITDLDAQGVHTVKTVLSMEHERCTKERHSACEEERPSIVRFSEPLK